MSEQNKETQQKQENLEINDLLMKPFSLGWTREVVMRVVTKNGAPKCDIYYFSPSKRKIRSFTELKNFLTDGLSLECFSFKREPLGLAPDLETIRDAKIKGKKSEKTKEKVSNVERNLKKAVKPDSLKQENDGCSPQCHIGVNKEEEEEEEETKVETGEAEIEGKENKTNLDIKSNQEAEGIKKAEEVEKNLETRSKRIRLNEKLPEETNSIKNNKKTRRKGRKPDGSVKMPSMRKKKNILKRMMSAKQAKQAKVVASKKILKKIVVNKVKASKQKLSKTRDKRESVLKSTKNKVKLKKGSKPLKNSLTKAKNETAKEPNSNETEKKSASRDLKSIVKKNIGKYREMREKQKLGTVKNQVKSTSKRTLSGSVNRARSEPISKNKPFYLKPLQKGWRRELVYRSNCTNAGQRADVYYFHPSGKKLRSSREISENLTHGLSIECFTFRKEPIGCGEPSEIIRNARLIQKNYAK